MFVSPSPADRKGAVVTLSTNGIHRHVCVGLKSKVKCEVGGGRAEWCGEQATIPAPSPLQVLFASGLRQ